MNSIRRNVALLAACQAMLFSISATLVTVMGLAGLQLAPDKSMATLPVTFWILGGTFATVPASVLQARIGRKAGLSAGALIGLVGCVVCALALQAQSFWLLCAGTLAFGASNAFGQYYRFVAADAAPPDFKATAISLVLAGGLLGGILGPSMSRLTVDAFDTRYMGTYIGTSLFIVATLLLLQWLDVPNPTAEERAKRGRPLAVIARQPKFIVAVLCSALGYGVMNFLMTATPIAMNICGHSFGDGALVISGHVIGMFAPSLFTGALVKRFGVNALLGAGVALNLASVGIGLSGIAVAHFWVALFVLGVGWNFLYVGGTALLTETYRPEERAKAQGANDFAVFAMMTLSSLASGAAVTSAGWQKVNYLALPMILVVMAAVAWLVFHQRAPRPA
jgi:MFS family permease